MLLSQTHARDFCLGYHTKGTHATEDMLGLSMTGPQFAFGTRAGCEKPVHVTIHPSADQEKADKAHLEWLEVGLPLLLQRQLLNTTRECDPLRSVQVDALPKGACHFNAVKCFTLPQGVASA